MAAEPDRNGGCRDSSEGEPDLNRDGEEQNVEQQTVVTFDVTSDSGSDVSDTEVETNEENIFYDELTDVLKQGMVDKGVFENSINEIDALRKTFNQIPYAVMTMVMQSLLLLPTIFWLQFYQQATLEQSKNAAFTRQYFDQLRQVLRKFQGLVAHFAKWKNAKENYKQGIEKAIELLYRQRILHIRQDIVDLLRVIEDETGLTFDAIVADIHAGKYGQTPYDLLPFGTIPLYEELLPKPDTTDRQNAGPTSTISHALPVEAEDDHYLERLISTRNSNTDTSTAETYTPLSTWKACPGGNAVPQFEEQANLVVENDTATLLIATGSSSDTDVSFHSNADNESDNNVIITTTNNSNEIDLSLTSLSSTDTEVNTALLLVTSGSSDTDRSLSPHLDNTYVQYIIESDSDRLSQPVPGVYYRNHQYDYDAESESDESDSASQRVIGGKQTKSKDFKPGSYDGNNTRTRVILGSSNSPGFPGRWELDPALTVIILRAIAYGKMYREYYNESMYTYKAGINLMLLMSTEENRHLLLNLIQEFKDSNDLEGKTSQLLHREVPGIAAIFFRNIRVFIKLDNELVWHINPQMCLPEETFTPTIPSRQQPVTKMEHHFSLTGKQDSLTAALVIQCNSEQGNSTEKRLGFDMQYQAKEKPNCACRQKSQQLIVPTIVKGKTSGVSRETVILQRGLERLTATTRRATADGLHVVDVRGDGACMFRAVCVSDTGSDIDHLLLREATIGYMRGNAADFIPYLNDEDLPFSEYLDRISRPNQQVGECALNAISNVLGKQVKVYFGDCEPNSYKPKWSDSDRLINVLYHDLTLSNNGHYMALVYSNSPRNTSVIGTSQSLYLPKH